MVEVMIRSTQTGYQGWGKLSAAQQGHHRNSIQELLKGINFVHSRNTEFPGVIFMTGGHSPPRMAKFTRSRPLAEVLATPHADLRTRLANVNDHFKHKAADVINDEDALGLLCLIYESVVVNISEFDACEYGVSLSKLTAADFCEVGAEVIQITESGRRFIDSINESNE